MKDDRDRLAVGFDGYLEKPINVRELPGQIAASLAGRRSGRDEPATILVVDDLPQNVRLLEAVLAPAGLRRRTAMSGARGARAAVTESVDLVLLDIVMPEMDGYEVCRAIRADAGTRFLPVVMITASGEQEKVAAIEAGADDFITKPFDQAELLARVRSLLRIKRYHDTIEAQAAELAAWNRAARAAGARPGGGARADRGGCGGSSRPSSPSWSSPRETSRS